ncbi:M1 family metallopeptidase [Novosphingobium aquiterrae]|uniref:Aminopeptidase n=1 Tax=Novosphingobium aquiterrae TaxID=624388 RepID=A0ABV6PJQ4_9SPHN
MRRLLLASSLISLVCAAPALAQAPVGAAATLPDVPKGQLTDAVRPSAYRLDLTVNPDKDRFSGKVEIDAVLKASSSYVDLHGRDLNITRAVATVGGRTYVGTWRDVDPSGVVRLSFAETLPAGAVTFAFDYDAAFQSSPAGMFRVKVGDDWYSWTQFESIDARAAFPSFDQPGYKQPFTVTLRTKPGQVAVSNAPEVSKTLEDGLEVHRFAPTLPLPTYLVAMMVGPFAVAEGTVPPSPQRATPLPLRIVTTKQNAKQMTFALEGSKGIVRHLEAYFNQAFPYPKLDQITTPILPGAMENAGADLYADPILIMDETASTRQKRDFGMIVSHELAHQWFGDLVTPTWWDDIWLNESFANWMGYRIGGEWRPDLNIGAGALVEGFGAMSTDALLAGRPIHQAITTNAQIDEAFDSITYGKGGHVVAMIAGYMGDTKFRDGVRRYMAAHKYGNATSKDFFAAMAEAAGDPRIIPAMQSFTDQQGVPLVTFSRGKGGAYTATQSRYVRLGTQGPDTRWGVPLCLRRIGATTQSCQLLTDKSAAVKLPGKGAFIPNAGGTGYYRFELPTADWDALIARASALSSGEALALDDSLLASFRAGRASPDQLIASARELAKNKDSYASAAGIDTLQALYGSGMLDEAGKAGYRRLVESLYRPRLAALGFDPRAGAYAKEDPEKSEQRAQIVGRLAVTARDAAVRKQLGQAARDYLAGKSDAIDQSWLGLGLGIVVEEGGLAAAKDLADKALASQDSVFRPASLGVIGGSGKADVAKWILTEFQDKRLRPNERLSLIGGVVRTSETRDIGFAWLKSNFDALMNSGGGIFFASRLPQIVGGFCSVRDADEIAALMRPKLAGKTGALELERTIERVRSCGVLKDARGAEASRAFAKLK